MEIHSENREEERQPVGLSSYVGPTSGVTPEVSLPPNEENQTTGCPSVMPAPQEGNPKKEPAKSWYVLRAAYSSERLTTDYIRENSKDIEVFWPTHVVDHVKKGKRVSSEESLIPNILFARATKEDLEEFVYDNCHLPYLRFYYHQVRRNDVLMREPLTVPERQMKSFMEIYNSAEDDIYIASDVIPKFTKGQMVRVIAGPFQGVVGRVARFKGQQRVGVIIGGLCTAVTTYIKNRYLEPLDEGGQQEKNSKVQ